MKKPEYTVEFYRVVSVKKKISASTPEELKQKAEKLIQEGVMDKNHVKTSETEWEVLFDE